ncbi:MAG: type II toxin-antitoxin system VapC family toxin [Polyangiaceae bacterium]
MLDTNAFLFWASGAKRLSPRARQAIANPKNDVFLSAVSSWEIAIKWALGKLRLPEPPSTFVPSRLRAHSIGAIPFDHADALAVATLPALHDDPFDRALIAQATTRKLAVVTSDDRFADYGVRVID